jgi:hypothetical protein
MAETRLFRLTTRARDLAGCGLAGITPAWVAVVVLAFSAVVAAHMFRFDVVHKDK